MADPNQEGEFTGEELEALALGDQSGTPAIELEVDINTEDPRWTASIPHLETFLTNALTMAAREESMDGEVSVLLTNDAHIRELNRQWRQQDKPTNVLSFPTPQIESWVLGDIALAYETVAHEAQEQGKTFSDHTTHLIVHGFLHLIDYDHIDDAEAERMEARETHILGLLSIADPYIPHV